jgi:hypothetical protein
MRPMRDDAWMYSAMSDGMPANAIALNVSTSTPCEIADVATIPSNASLMSSRIGSKARSALWMTDWIPPMSPVIGVQQGENQKGAAFDLFARLNAALFPPLADPSPSAVLLAVRAQPDRSLAVRRVVDLSALAPSSDGLFVRLAIETGSR